MALDFADKMAQVSADIRFPEQMLGTGLLEPFNGTNAGSRKIMHNTHRSHIFPLVAGDKAILETGYEIRFGDYSSSVTKADSDYRVIAKISKFSFAPNHHYWLILEDMKTKKLDVQERISYHYITQSYGYLYNNEFLDNLNVGDIIPNDTITQKSLAFDEYNNRKDGVNFNVCYMALDDNMEDSIIFSSEAAGRLTAPLIKPVPITINDNDIPLNIYGNSNVYKVIPDIGEEVKNATLIATRKEKKDESYYTQSDDRLREIMMSDNTKQINGRVIDVDIYCNNPDILSSKYYSQLKMYHDELLRCSSEIAKFVLPYVSQGYKLTYELQKLYYNSIRVSNGDKYIEKRPYSNIILNVTVLEEIKMGPGDKASNRYGGKGIVSNIWPQYLMPRFKNLTGDYEYIDVIFNSSTMIGRENCGQSIEQSVNHGGCSIVDRIKADKVDLHTAYKWIYDFINLFSPEQAQYMDGIVKNMSEEDLGFFVESIIDSGSIHLSIKPISEAVDIDKIAEMYRLFPWIEQNKVEVPLEDSSGNIRYIPARRTIVVGKQYIFRLKQFAEEKYSATSLSATNIRNENIKTKAKKDARTIYPNTPVRFGSMETNNFNHLGPEIVIANMMIHSLSPQARRLVEQFYTTDNPFIIDIKLNSDSRNRSAEIVNTYLKTSGRVLVFEKKLKKLNKVLRSPISFFQDPVHQPIHFIPKQDWDKEIDYEKEFEERQKINKMREEGKITSPIIFDGGRDGVKFSK